MLATICNFKGGVGKSTVSYLLSLGLLEVERTPKEVKNIGGDVIMIDLNSQSQLHLKYERDIPAGFINKDNGRRFVQPNLLTFQEEYNSASKKDRVKLSLEQHMVTIPTKSNGKKLKLLAGGKSLELYSQLSKNDDFLKKVYAESRVNDVIVDTPATLRSLEDISLKVMGISDRVVVVTELDPQAFADSYDLGTTLLAYKVLNRLLKTLRDGKNQEKLKKALECTGYTSVTSDNYAEIERAALNLDKIRRSSSTDILTHQLDKIEKSQEALRWYSDTVTNVRTSTKLDIVVNKVAEGGYVDFIVDGQIEKYPQQFASKALFDRLCKRLGEKGIESKLLATLPFSESLRRNIFTLSTEIETARLNYENNSGLFGLLGIGRNPETLEEHVYKMAKDLKGRK